MRQWTPRAYQPPVIEHILRVPRCAIWAGMGLGKTVSTLSALDAMFLAGEDRPALVLSPLRVARTTWPEEARKWNHLRHISVAPVVGSEGERKLALRTDASVFTTNYEQLPWLVEHFGDRWPFRTVVADESTKLKGFRLRQGTMRARHLARVAHKHCTRFIELTGTCAPNGLQDLWGQLWFIDAGQRLGRTFDAFRSRWFQQSHDGYGYTALPHAQDEIQERLRDVCLTIDAKDYFDLREPITTNIYIELPASARRMYREMEREMWTEIAGHGVEAVNAAARTNKCLQLSNGAVYVDEEGTWKEAHGEKLDALDDIIEEASGAPVLVAYNFRSDLERLQRAFPKGRVLDKDPATITDWNAGRIPLLFAHPASAGHGLNLQDGGNILVFFGLSWNLEERLQILERIGPVRQLQAGHDRPVFVYNILARGTVDEMVLERVETKRSVQDILLEAMKRRAA